ncbi:MAG: glycoside hydrolase family 97 protein [Cyclobacteriaceae bacterium]
MKRSLLVVTAIALISASCSNNNTASVDSPGGVNSIEFHLSPEGVPVYSVKHNGETVIGESSMGFDFKDQPSLHSGLEIVKTTTNTKDETWPMPWGEQREVRDNHNELIVELKEKAEPNRLINIYFKAFDDGIGFRYEFLAQPGVDSLVIMDENTEFQLMGDHTAWWAPGDWDIYEHLYNTTRVSQIDAISKRNHPNLAQTYIPENAVNTPFTLRADNGVHMTFHEANLTDYSDMTLKVDNSTFMLTSELVGSDRLGYKVKRALPFKTPWRALIIADKATELIDSKIILNLNEPNKLGDVSYFKPKKYVGIWWEMHIGKSTWDYAGSQDMNTWSNLANLKPTGKHGATTANAKRYIDFASKNSITGLLVEGWNVGWEHWIGFEDREGVFDFVTPYPDYDLKEVVRYGNEKGVELIMHHETSAAPRTYDQQMDTAYKLMQSLGVHAVKTGYVGKIIPKGEYHHGQWMVQHYRRALDAGAKYQVAVNAHEPIKATGIRRTYPNAIAREGLRGQEFNAWATDGGNPPEHLPIIAFTRMLAGPIDFTPGVFEIGLPTKPNNQINTTLAQQLALYVVIYSPVQMACDLPENYEGKPALQFIRDVGVDWDKTVVLNGEVGDFVTIVRQERGTGNWFLGSITDEQARDITVTFDFLDEGKTYKASVYRDGTDAHFRNNPTSIEIEQMEIKKGDSKTFHLAEGGGLAISLIQ